MADWYPFVVLLVGLVVVIGGITVLRLHAFLALVCAAMAVSLMAPGDWDTKIVRVAEAFGSTATSIGIVIAMAAIIGGAMTASGAADRVVQMFVDWLGEKRGAAALAASGFLLAVPVFFDTVFYLLVPLVRSMYRRTRGHYVKYLVAAASSASAHALVPPTPGPLVIASTLGVSIGMMMMVGAMVALPASVVGLLFAGWCDRRMRLTPPDEAPVASHAEVAAAAHSDQPLPSLSWALAPIAIPVVLITMQAVVKAWEVPLVPAAASVLAVVGNPNMALLLAAGAALVTQRMYRQESLHQLAGSVEQALMSGGVIVLITSAGGAFGAMLKAAEIAPAIQDVFGESVASGMTLLWLAFFISSLLKFAQGSSTAAMIVTAGMMAAMIEPSTLGYHPVYVATAIGSGSLVGSWMNDSGFWIYAKMGGLTEIETLKTWTPLLAILGCVAMLMTLLLATLMPMVPIEITG